MGRLDDADVGQASRSRHVLVASPRVPEELTAVVADQHVGLAVGVVVHHGQGVAAAADGPLAVVDGRRVEAPLGRHVRESRRPGTPVVRVDHLALDEAPGALDLLRGGTSASLRRCPSTVRPRRSRRTVRTRASPKRSAFITSSIRSSTWENCARQSAAEVASPSRGQVDSTMPPILDGLTSGSPHGPALRRSSSARPRHLRKRPPRHPAARP